MFFSGSLSDVPEWVSARRVRVVPCQVLLSGSLSGAPRWFFVRRPRVVPCQALRSGSLSCASEWHARQHVIIVVVSIIIFIGIVIMHIISTCIVNFISIMCTVEVSSWCV